MDVVTYISGCKLSIADPNDMQSLDSEFQTPSSDIKSQVMPEEHPTLTRLLKLGKNSNY